MAVTPVTSVSTPSSNPFHPTSSRERKPALALAAAALLVAGGLLVVPHAAAQNGPLFYFDWSFDTDKVTLVMGGSSGQGTIQGTFIDNSLDLPPPGVTLYSHTVDVSLEYDNVPGWFAKVQPPEFFTTAGSQTPFQVLISAGPDATAPYFEVDLKAVVTTEDGGQVEKHAKLQGYDPGISQFNSYWVKVPPNAAEPRQLVQGAFLIQNLASLPRTYDIALKDNDCDMLLGFPRTVIVDAKTTETFTIDIQTPDSKHWYLLGDQCRINFDVTSPDQPLVGAKSLGAMITVTGVSLDPGYIAQLLLIAAAIFLIILFFRRRKEKLEEEILGKPQKPWLIPAEKMYLEAIKRKDPRAAYLVRHHLMEEEYKSSLLWYAAFKKATKGDRKKERVVLAHEKDYEKWRKSWTKAIAKPLSKAERYEAKLQGKLDRKARKANRKAVRHAKVVTRKLKATHRKQVARADEKHAKAVAKAEKKGRPAPPAPSIPEPQYPGDPTPQAKALGQHRWSKKAARFRRRMLKRQANLEVRFEKADTRYRARLVRKVGRIGRKIDDDEFVKEHPLLKDAKRA
jgi:hypothetical protein